MNKRITTSALALVACILIVAWANLQHPHPLYWGAWAVLAILTALQAVTITRGVRGRH